MERVAEYSVRGGRDVAEAQSGDREAFARLYVELRPLVRNTAYRLIGDEHEAEDTAQDAFLTAFVSLPHLADPTAFEAWLLKITRNRAVDRRRGMMRCRPSGRVHDDGADQSCDLPKVVLRKGVAEPSPESVAMLRCTLDEMAGTMRDALRLRYVKGLSCEEIARRKGITVMAVKTRLFRARRLLRAALAGDPGAPRRRRVAPSEEKESAFQPPSVEPPAVLP